MKLIWSEAYEVELFGHVFPVQKYRLVKDALLRAGIAAKEDFILAPRARQEDLRLVHTREYIDDLMHLRQTPRTMRSEMALTREIVDAYLTATGGTIEASSYALKDGVCVHIGGGYHHAYPDHAEGFCYLNDVSVAVAKTKKEGLILKACVIDCDLHQGNGTAFIFAQDPDVFTFSIHQENNYPPKERSDFDIGLPDRAGDDLYLQELRVVTDLLDAQKPEIAFYLAGADPFEGDMLGGLALSKEGLKKRDTFVLEECRKRSVPVCIVLAGGYAFDVSDDVDIHVSTIIQAKQVFA